MTPPTWLVMDLGDVVLRFAPDARLAGLADLAGLPTDTVQALVFESGFDDAGDRGVFGLDEYRAQLLALLGLTDTTEHRAALIESWATAFVPNPRVLALLDRVSTPIATLSDNGPMLEAVLYDVHPEVVARFDRILLSHALGATKPDPEIYRRAADVLGVPADQIAFVDDRADNVAGATAAGW